MLIKKRQPEVSGQPNTESAAEEEYGVTGLEIELDISEMPTVQAAKLVHVSGKGALTVQITHNVDPSGSRLMQFCLNGIPLVQVNAPYCPTCSSILATGYGLANANCQELEELRDRINAPFHSLETSIEDLEPLLTLLKSGLYVIADGVCYPTDGDGTFFWNVPNEPKLYPATAGILLPDADYTYVSGQPAYLYPTQDTDCYDEARVQYYMECFRRGERPPRAVVHYSGGFMNFILDGHHKACAAVRLGIPLHCTMILPLGSYEYRPVEGQMRAYSLWFAGIRVPIEAVPEKYRPPKPALYTPKQFRTIRTEAGTIIHRTWEAEYLESARQYLPVTELAEIIAAGIFSIDAPMSDEELAAYLSGDLSDDDWEQKMSAVLSLLWYQRDPRLKQAALSCAALPVYCELKKQAYQLLAAIKDDEDVEQLFIDYLVECEDEHDPMISIVHGYWE